MPKAPRRIGNLFWGGGPESTCVDPAAQAYAMEFLKAFKVVEKKMKKVKKPKRKASN